MGSHLRDFPILFMVVEVPVQVIEHFLTPQKSLIPGVKFAYKSVGFHPLRGSCFVPITENPTFKGNIRVEIKVKPTMKDRYQRDGSKMVVSRRQTSILCEVVPWFTII